MSYCCRLDQEFICGIVRNRSGIDSGELDISIRVERAEKDLPNVIKEVEWLLKRLNEMALRPAAKPAAYRQKPGQTICAHGEDPFSCQICFPKPEEK